MHARFNAINFDLCTPLIKRVSEKTTMLPIYLLLLYWWLYRRFVRPAYRRWREVRLRTLQKRVVLLWQFPVAGRVKKNFVPLLGAEGAADLQLALVGTNILMHS